MNPIKEYQVKIKKITKELKSVEEKYNSEREKNKELRKGNRYLKKRNKVLTASRDNWKEKNKDKKLTINCLELKIAKDDKIARHHYPKMIIIVSILLRIKGGCSYGAIIKILKIIAFCFHLQLQKIPCENSIQNWVSKVGLYMLEKQDKGLKGKQVSLIVDESIRMGREKQLLVLAIPWKKEKEDALKFEDVQVVHLEGSISWNGEKIAKVIDDLIKKHGFEVKNILSDEDSKLKKASRLSEIVHLPDISHAVATCLRRSFEKEESYKAFTTLIASYQRKGVNQDISYLHPPKQRSKARFMNQSGIVNWSGKMLERFDKLGEKAKEFFQELPDHQPIIDELEISLLVAKHISLSFKNKGLSLKTLKSAQIVTQIHKREEGLFGVFLTQLNGYLTQYQEVVKQLGNTAIDVCSEIIECLFGKYKSKAHSHPLTGLTKLNLEIPLYCLTNKELVQQIPIALENISMNQLETWVEKHSSDNQLIKRIAFFKN